MRRDGHHRPPNRHDLRHTGLTRFADAGDPVHVLRRIAGHGSLTTTQRYGRRRSTLRIPRPGPRPHSLPSPIGIPGRHRGRSAGPQPVPKNDQRPASDSSEAGPDLRLASSQWLLCLTPRASQCSRPARWSHHEGPHPRRSSSVAARCPGLRPCLRPTGAGAPTGSGQRSPSRRRRRRRRARRRW
ncbi:site-specific integrase [Streptomyces achromogenes]|uniref:Site-specific integrase n=1 Tax=Streptomyces achromogenes TaxID=67255 RepID=A0ABZ1KZ33_STRAH